ncbi:impB/mucB/samB family protein [Streptomyces sp. TLI_053]|uniref:DNA polymerase Y family protein n=1 Tax=Streptomyces sp. TLI_053 TaxID=1855352 RepID=UPI00087C254E|nr:DNA polymerase Y family protein [Streptomyces sp. TLI_053]SDT79192.1 impB/mucB/samB family protein [Streptomyces sp. TLI_053]
MTGGEVAGSTGASGAVTPRVLVVWCPDWPVVAVERPEEDRDAPVAVVEGGRVLACSATARAAGVRQGQRLKLAQRLCPALELRDRDPEAEARRFEPVAAAVEAFTPRVEVLRPGLCAIPVKGPARYFGGEEALAAKVRAAVTAALAVSAEVVAVAEAVAAAVAGPQRQPADAEAGTERERGDGHGDGDGLAEVVPLRPAAPGHPADAERAGAARRRTAGTEELFSAAPPARDGARGGFARPPACPSAPPSEPVPGPGAGTPAAPALVQPLGLVGVADGLFAAVLAARAGVLVPAGRTAEFLAPYPVAALGDAGLAELLDRLGLPTVGAFAALPAESVADRFGPTGATAHRLARGLQPRPLVPRAEGPDLSVEQRFDPPEPLAEPLVFVARTLAERLHQRLAGAGLTCQRVAVEVVCADGRTVARLWRHEGRLSATALAERVRWQLQAWQSAGTFDRIGESRAGGSRAGESRPGDDGPGTGPEVGGFTALRLVPDDLTPDQGRQLALWGQAVADDRVERAVARVQAVLGHAGLRRIEPAGGRGPEDQVVRVPWGEPYDPAAPADAPWPGRVGGLRDVWPSVVHRVPVPVTVLDADGRAVTVDGRAGVSARPAVVAVRGRELPVEGWTGPWPAVEYWWDQARARRRARFQVTVADGRALLLTVEGGAWFVEAGYD